MYYSDNLNINVNGNYSLNTSTFIVTSDNFNIDDSFICDLNDSFNINAHNIYLSSTYNYTITFGVKKLSEMGYISSFIFDKNSFDFEGNSTSFLYNFNNLGDSTTSSLLKLDFENLSSLEYDNMWIGFYSEGSLKGAIRGAVIDGDSEYPAFKSVDLDERAQNTDSGKLKTTGAGYVQYTTGGSDFGEWLEIGDINEWTFPIINNILKIPEGMIVYIMDNKIWKNKFNGTPMIVTSRAGVLGNLKNNNEKIGAIISFTGQVPVMLSSDSNDGDYLIPFKNECFSVSKHNITFEQYKLVIGTAWGSTYYSNDKKMINCAVGIK